MARLYVSKLKGEIKLLTQKCVQLDEQKSDSDKTYEQKVKELEECRLLIIQNEAKIKSQQEYIKEIEGRKRKLEDDIDVVNEELAKIKAQGYKNYFFFKLELFVNLIYSFFFF